MLPGIIPTASQSARLNALVRVSRSLETRLRQRWLLSIHRPDSSVAWASPLPEPRVGEVRNALREAKPAASSFWVPASSTALTWGASAGSSTASRP